MLGFILLVGIVLSIWAACSLAEAAMYAVPMPYIRQLEDSHDAAGPILARLKDNMERPISAILVVNTIVAAAGASAAGARAVELFGSANLWIFSLAFTIVALVVSEIMPKVLGVAYNRQIARALAKPLEVGVVALYPLVWLIEKTSSIVRPQSPPPVAPEEEVQTMAAISAEEGSILPHEADLVQHVLNLDRVTAAEIMTPRSVVVTLPEDLTLRRTAQLPMQWNFSRIPIYDPNRPDRWTGFVLSRDVLAAVAQGQFELRIGALAKPLHFVREATPAHVLLDNFLRRRTHLFGVLGPNNKVVGIVTLEDVLESLVGAEIVDEFDCVVDMRTLGDE